eukprot:4415025-Pyramimonas_sp.AAC.2
MGCKGHMGCHTGRRLGACGRREFSPRRVNFTSLRVNFSSLRVNFSSLRVNFSSLKDPRFLALWQVEGYLSGVPVERLWLLDLFAERQPMWSRTASFRGHPFLFCTLLNFGGQSGVAGDLAMLHVNLDEALHPDANNTMLGVGITMEGAH